MPYLATHFQENRKRETRQLAAQVVRREEEMTENHLGDNESEGDAPDDDDDLDEVRAQHTTRPIYTVECTSLVHCAVA